MPDIDIQRLMVRLEARIDRYEQNLAKANAQTEKRARAIEQRFDQTVRRLDDAGDKMGRVYDPMLAASRRAETALNASSGRIKTALLGSASSLATGLAAGFTVNKVAEYADAYTRFTNQLSVAGLAGEKLKGTQEQLYAVAQKYGVQLEGLGRLYGGLSTLQKDLNTTSADSIALTTAVAASIKIGGESSDKASGAILGLNQALAQTRVQSDEYNQILDGARPLLMAAVQASEKYGGSLAKLKQDIEAGNVSGAELFRILQGGFPVLAKQAESAKLTIGNSLIVINNALGKYIGEADASLSATERFAAGISALANNLDLIIPAVAGIAAMYGTRLLVGAAAAHKEELKLAAAIASGSTEYASNAKLALTKSRSVAAAAEVEIASTKATIAALREEAAQYQANIALANQQRLAAKAAQAQAAANAAAGFGTIKVGAGGLSTPANGARAAEQFAQAGKNAVADRQRLASVTRELEAAEAALAAASARSVAAEATRKKAFEATTLSMRAGAAAAEIFSGALTMIGGSVAGGAVVLTLGAIVGAMMIHNRHVKEAEENHKRLGEVTKDLNAFLKESAQYGRAAAEGVKGLGSEASTATPQVQSFAGAVGQLANELHRAATERRNLMIATAEQKVQDTKSALEKARTDEQRQQITAPVIVAGGGVMMAAPVKNSRAAKDVLTAQDVFTKAEAELKRLKGLSDKDFYRPTDRTKGRDLAAEAKTLEHDLRVAQAGGDAATVRDLKAQIYTLKKTQEYSTTGDKLSFETAYAKASREAQAIKSAGDRYAAGKEGAKVARQAVAAERADLAHDRRYAADLARAQDDQLQAQADLSSTTADRLAVELARIETARKARLTELAEQSRSKANPSGYSAEEIANLSRLADDTADKQKRHARALADQQVADDALAVASAERELRGELLSAQVELSTTVADRASLELRILDIQQEEEKARLEAVVASKTATDAEKKVAEARLKELPALQAAHRRIVERQNEYELSSYRRSLVRPDAEVYNAAAVDGLEALRGSLIAAAKQTGDFGDEVMNVGEAVADQLLGQVIDRLFIAPAAEAADKFLDGLLGTGKVAADTSAAAASSARATADVAAATATAGLTAAALSASAALAAVAASSAAGAAAAGGSLFGALFGGAGVGLRRGGQIPGYAGGGLLSGPGGPTDDAILAQMASGRFIRLSNKEFVVNAEATRNNLGLLRAINSGRMPRYAKGGALNYGLPAQISAANSAIVPRGIASRRGGFVKVDLNQTINMEGANGDATIRAIAYDAARQGFQATRAAATNDLARRMENTIP